MELPKTYRKLVAARLTPHFREAAEVVEEPLAPPGPGEILVRNLIAGVNATDVNIAAGRYDPGAKPPLDLGIEAAGEIVSVGPEVTDLKPGDFVVTAETGGGYRAYHTLPAKRAIPVPAATPEAVSLVVSGLTASIALHVAGEMGSGETVLVTAAAGGTGQYAVQLAKLAGNHVIGTCGTPEKAEMLRSLGCDRVINYREEDVRSVLASEYPNGVDLVYESVGGEMFDVSLRALAVHGRLLTIGFISEYVGGVETVRRPRIYTQLLPKSASVRGFFLPHFTGHMREHMMRLIMLLSEGKLRIAVDPTPFEGLDAVVDAVEYLHSGKSRGKVVVRFPAS